MISGFKFVRLQQEAQEGVDEADAADVPAAIVKVAAGGERL